MTDSSEYDKGNASPVVAVREGSEALFDGTATLTVDGVVVLIPTPSVDPQGKNSSRYHIFSGTY
jgi:hypothetical protein